MSKEEPTSSINLNSSSEDKKPKIEPDVATSSVEEAAQPPEHALSSTSLQEPIDQKSSDGVVGVVLPAPIIINFSCHLCGMRLPCDYYGDHPPFAPTNRFTEPCYVKKDPFAPYPCAGKSSAEYLLVLGADCARCARQTCRSANCSVYYRTTVCLRCAQRYVGEYPTEIQSKIKKQIQNAASASLL